MKLLCFHCGQPLQILPEHLGSEVICPHCHEAIALPKAADETLPESDEAPLVTGSWFSSSFSALASVVIHAGLFLVFALVTCDYRGGSRDQGTDVLLGELPNVELSQMASEELDAAVESVSQSNEALDEMLDVASAVEASDSEWTLDVDLATLAPSAAAAGGDPGIGAIVGGGGAMGQGASFMGLSATGTRFCIIADNSGSMEGPKLAHVKQEVMETLTTMGPNGRFQLIFFNSNSVPFPQPGWRHPRRDRAAVEQWLQSLGAGGGTYPTPAFRAAFNLSPRPDAIFFMTDGQFPEQAVVEIRDLNARGGRKVKIHAISFIDTSGEAQMRQIASDSGGKYRHVAGF